MVSSILQDHNGYMWFGTKDGLNRFDGYSYKIYKSDLFDSSSIGDNHITCLFEDREKNLWIGSKLGGLNLYDPIADSFFKVIDSRLNGKPIIISAITGNVRDGLWLTTLEGDFFGIDILEIKAGMRPKVALKTFPKFKIDPKTKVLIAFLDQSRLLWITTSKGVQLYDLNTRKWAHLGSSYHTYKVFDKSQAVAKFQSDRYSPFSKKIYEIVEDENRNIWLASDEGIYMYDHNSRYFVFYELAGWIKTIAVSYNSNGEKEVWVGSFFNGVMILNTSTNKLEVIEYNKFSNLGILNGLVNKIYKGTDGTIWMGTNGRGIVYFSPNNSLFHNNMPQRLINDQPSVYSILPLKSKGDNSIIINTLQYFFHEDLTYGHSKYDTSFYSRVTYEDQDGQIWLGTSKGLVRYNIETKKITPIDSNEKIVFGIYKSGNKLWYSTPNSLKLYNTVDKSIHSFQLIGKDSRSGIESHEILYSTITPDPDGSLWVGAVNGLYHFDPVQEKVIAVYKNTPNDSKSISSNEIKSILPDPFQPNKILWVGTPAGLNKLDKETGTFTHLNISDGLPNNTIYGILADSAGNLWLSTNYGLSVFNIDKKSFTNFDVNNGLQSNEFNTGAYHQSHDGEMFFGGISGYNRFYPEKIKLPANNIPIVISDVSLLGSSKSFSFSLLGENKLTYDNNNISITLASLDYASPEKLRYAYRILNNDSTWIMLGNNRTITLSNLSPGRYIFQGKGTDSFGRWGDKVVTMVFVISPPWWKSIWAFLFYFILFGSLLYYLWNRNKQQLIQKHQLEDERRQSAAILELDQAKSKFIDNITHEFRTPLTMILGLTDETKRKEELNKEEEFQKNETIRRNGKQLLNLVDQLLELSRLESSKHYIDLEAGVLSVYLSHIVHSFDSLASLRGIEVIHEIDFGHKVFMYDLGKIQQVLSNLISNAIKFSKDNSKVTIHSSLVTIEETKQLRVEVSDEGIGIPDDELNRIFDRFHRVRLNESKQLPGTGIGLALAKELVELMGGKIEARSEFGKGSIFRFEIPVIEAENKESENRTEVPDPKEITLVTSGLSDQTSTSEKYFLDTDSDIPVILIVEDNNDVREYIYSCVSQKFKVITAINGEDGWNKAIEYMPDIIISDVMMPEKDGFSLCDDIKRNPITSHIPVILLTAKVDAKSKIAGLKKGADSYLAKPFDREELLLILENISFLIRRMQLRYTRLLSVAEPLPSNEDELPGDSFLNQVLEILESCYQEEEYTIEDMAGRLFMSRSQLFRKIKALTGHSPSTFLRTFRLRKAKLLLTSHPEMNISEVAYATGFTSPKYFSNVFLEEFGHRPK